MLPVCKVELLDNAFKDNIKNLILSVYEKQNLFIILY